MGLVVALVYPREEATITYTYPRARIVALSTALEGHVFKDGRSMCRGENKAADTIWLDSYLILPGVFPTMAK